MSPKRNTQFPEKVTDCGGVPSNNDQYISFTHQVAKAKTKISFNNFQLVVHSQVTVDLICRYNSTITVDSNEYVLKEKKPVTKLAVEVSVLTRRKCGIWIREN